MKWVLRQAVLWHRYLGIVLCLFFAVWFISGIVLIYAYFPHLTEADRLPHLPELNLSSARLTPAEGLARTTLSTKPLRITIGMVGSRPVYRFLPESGAWVSVFADTGQVLQQLEAATAVDIARLYDGSPYSKMYLVRELKEVDLWTVYSYPAARPYLPLLLIAAEDDRGTEYYVSEATGFVYLKITNRDKFLAWIGAIPHWWYIRALRANPPLWHAVVIAASGLGVVLCLAGIVASILVFSPSRRYRLPGSRYSVIPYVGWKRWHYFVASVFGLVTFTWILSGLFTMSPGNWSPGPSPGRAEIKAFAGADLDPDAFHLPPARAIGLIQKCIQPSDVEMIMFGGLPYYLARDAKSQVRLLSAHGDSEHCISEVAPQELLAAAKRVVGTAPVSDSELLTSYDTYYYDRNHRKPLPVLRVRFADGRRTWLYINPRTALIEARYTDRSRLERWLWYGLHDLDFPFLYWHRPTWDVTVISLCVGGFVLSITSIVLAVTYLRK